MHVCVLYSDQGNIYCTCQKCSLICVSTSVLSSCKTETKEKSYHVVSRIFSLWKSLWKSLSKQETGKMLCFRYYCFILKSIRQNNMLHLQILNETNIWMPTCTSVHLSKQSLVALECILSQMSKEQDQALIKLLTKLLLKSKKLWNELKPITGALLGCKVNSYLIFAINSCCLVNPCDMSWIPY